ncbi:MAG: hypothetical protein KME35_16800 [Aphanocapsa sp. GSE-SYN-MK-11-07L]|jgi:hypothetical protein|nr:hypothetical protein [Aphanocapsa sp. GSE-SYN-MK-11-07L]
MGNPLRNWKFLPWRSLFLTAVVTVLIAKIFDAAIGYGSIYSQPLDRVLTAIVDHQLAVILFLLLYCGLGALAVYLLETVFSPGPIYASTLWALILCLVLTLMVALLIFRPLPVVLFSLDQNLLVGLTVGVFWKGRSHWRW